MNIYVGNLDRKTTEDELKSAFEAFGAVKSVAIIKDKITGEARGFGFIEMDDKAQADAAIAGLNGKEISGRNIIVNEARPKTEGGGGAANLADAEHTDTEAEATEAVIAGN